MKRLEEKGFDQHDRGSRILVDKQMEREWDSVGGLFDDIGSDKLEINI